MTSFIFHIVANVAIERLENSIVFTPGNLSLNGTAIVSQDITTIASGNLLLTGQNITAQDVSPLAAGNLLLTGQGLTVEGSEFLGVGNLKLTGTAIVSQAITNLASGNLLLTGTDLVDSDITVIDPGNLLLTGTAIVSQAITHLEDGNMALTGSAIVSEASIALSSGSMMLTGSALTVYDFDILSAGNMALTGSDIMPAELLVVTSSANSGAGTLREAFATVQATGLTGRYSIRLDVDVNITDRISCTKFGDLELYSNNGQTISGAYVVLGGLNVNEGFTTAHVHNLRFYNFISELSSSGNSSNRCLSFMSGSNRKGVGDVTVHNCALAGAQDQAIDMNDIGTFDVYDCFIGYGMKPLNVTGTGTPHAGGTGMLTYFAGGTKVPMVGILRNCVLHGLQYRGPQCSNGDYASAGNHFSFFLSHQVFGSNQDGHVNLDILGNHYLWPYVGWDGDRNGRIHATNVQWYAAGNTQAGFDDTFNVTIDAPGTNVPELAQINEWPAYRDATDLADIQANVGTSTWDAIEQMFYDDITLSECFGETPSDMPTNAAQIRWDYGTRAKVITSPHVLSWGKTTTDGNERRILISAIQDFSGSPVPTADIDISLYDSDGVLVSGWHGVVGDDLKTHTVVGDAAMLSNGILDVNQELTFDLALLQAADVKRIVASFRSPAPAGSTAAAQIL